MENKNFDFGEQAVETSSITGKKLAVRKTPEYERAKKHATELLKEYDGILIESDFRIQKGEEDAFSVAYTGMKIGHNACQLINNYNVNMEYSEAFDASSVVIDKNAYAGKLMVMYVSENQGIFEVAESSLKDPDPYKKALDLCFDRVILKANLIAGTGITSELEPDEEDVKDPPKIIPQQDPQPEEDWCDKFFELCEKYKLNTAANLKYYGLNSESTNMDFFNAFNDLKGSLAE